MADFEATGGNVVSLTGSEKSYTLRVSPKTIGTLTVALKAGSALDKAGNGNARVSASGAVTGLEGNALSALTRVYPNPTTGRLYVGFGWAGKKTLSVMDALGRVAIELSASGEDAEIDLSAMPSGTYMLLISDGENVAVKRVRKE